MPVRYVLNRLKSFFIYRVLHVDDTPHRIALGVAVGIFITWTPTISLQMVLTVALSALLRANKVVGVPFVWISNPATLAPIYLPNYFVGCWILRQPRQNLEPLFQAWDRGLWDGLVAMWQTGWQGFWPLWTGSIVVGGALGVLSYFATRFAVVRYRRWWHRKHDQPQEGRPSWAAKAPAEPSAPLPPARDASPQGLPPGQD
jgi:uncharacterized protein (DUF2062 family)